MREPRSRDPGGDTSREIGFTRLEETQVERLGLQAWMREPRNRDPGGDTRRKIGFTSLEERTKEQRPWRRHT